MPKILAVETAVPAHRYEQDQLREICKDVFHPLLDKAGRIEMFDRAGVRTRYFSEPKEYYLANPKFEARNRDYLKHSLRLSEQCIRGCLAQTGANFSEIAALISVTTTGLLTPSLEAHLAQALPFPRTMKRTPLFGVGCAGGAVGLSRAFDYLEGRPEEKLLLLSVELCSLTFRHGDRVMTQLVAATLFGDGAGAALLAGDKDGGDPGVEILGAQSFLLPESIDIMGWDFDEDGMRLVLSSRAPSLIEKSLAPAVEEFLRPFGLRLSDIRTFLFHPGSARIIESCERALRLSAEDTRYSRRFLAAYGNLSSASLLFILKDALEGDRPAAGSYALMGAFGPGFSCELLLLRFP